MSTSIIQGFSNKVGRAVIHGGSNATNLGRIEGLKSDATLLAVVHVSSDLVTNTNVTAEASISTYGFVQLTTTDTTGDFLVVVWADI